MSAPILLTKLFIPTKRPELVSRPHLIEQLNRGPHRKLTLISAPAGFGKTTLVTEWLQSQGDDASSPFFVGWVSLDEDDNDLIRFVTYLVSALNRLLGLETEIGSGALTMVQAPQPPPPETILTTVINEIALLSENLILVLDDYHLIDNQVVHESLNFLIGNLPTQLHLVITTREDPPISIARLRARGQLSEIRAADLRFTSAETADFLNRVMELNLSAAEIAALETRTEGWITGLQMAAISIQGSKDVDDFIESFAGSHRYVLDYLIEEVLEQQTEEIQTFLLQISILDRLTGSLCDAVTGQENSRETLEKLERANMFIIPLDNERQWYRFHHLFADLLRQRLRQAHPDQVKPLHQNASDWYEQNEMQSDAVRHSLAANDFERVANFAELCWQAMDNNFQSGTWQNWVAALPDELIRNRPVLSTQYAWALWLAGELEASEAKLNDAEKCLVHESNISERPESSAAEMVVVDQAMFQTLPANIAQVRGSNAQARGDLSAAQKYIELALSLTPEDDPFARASLTVDLGFIYWAKGDLEAAHTALTDWINSMRLAGNIFFVLASTFALADIQVAQGRLRAAVSTYKDALQLASQQDEQIQTVVAHLYLGLALLYHEMGDQQVAAQHLRTSEKLGQQSTLPDWPYRWCLAQAKFKESERDLETALDLLGKAKHLYVRNVLPDVRPIVALQARVYLKLGRLAQAQAWARDRNLSVDDDLSFLSEFEYLIFARILIAEYENNHSKHTLQQVIRLLARLLTAAEDGNRIGRVIEVLVLQAQVHQVQGDLSLALACLERAISLAEIEGHLRTFVDAGQPMTRLLYKALSRGIAPDYVQRILAAFPVEIPEQMGRTQIQSHGSELIEPLSNREIEVLRLVAEGLSRQEIASQLVLSLNTVKTHARNIYSKLGVNNQMQAVRKARALGLLEKE